jgi:hypothetical protein
VDKREEQMRQDIETAIQKFEALAHHQLQQLPKCLWDMPYEEFLQRGRCVHEVLLSLGTDWKKKGKEEEKE